MPRAFSLALASLLLIATTGVASAGDPQRAVVQVRSLALDSHSPSGTPTVPNALCNPGFENLASTCWSLGAFEPNHAAVTTTDSHNGSYAVELCANDTTDCLGAVAQTINVPAELDSATGSVWVKGQISDTTSDCTSFVGLLFQVFGEPPGVFTGLAECDGSIPATWTELSGDLTEVLEPYEGETLTIYLLGQAYQDGDPPVTGTLFADDAYLGITGSNPTKTIHKRAIDLNLRRHLKAKGVVTVLNEGPNICLKQVPVKIQRRKDGKWVNVDSTTTDALGLYVKGIPDKPGTYRALAPRVKLSDTEFCGKAVSGTETHKH